MMSEHNPPMQRQTILDRMRSRTTGMESQGNLRVDSQPSFPLGFEPPAPADELMEDIGVVLVEADELMAELRSKIEGMVARERSAVDTAFTRVAQPINEELMKVIVDAADLLKELTDKIGDVIFDEMQMIGEDTALLLREMLGDDVAPAGGGGGGGNFFGTPPPPPPPPPPRPPLPPVPPPPPADDCRTFGSFPLPAQDGLIQFDTPDGPQEWAVHEGPFLGLNEAGDAVQLSYLVGNLGGEGTVQFGGTVFGFAPEGQEYIAGSTFWTVTSDGVLPANDAPILILHCEKGITLLAVLQTIGNGTMPDQQEIITCVCADNGCPVCPRCDDVPKDKDCIRICPPDDDKPKTSKPCTIWVDHETCEFYALEEDVEPRHEDDLILGGSLSGDQVQSTLDRVCGPHDHDDNGQNGSPKINSGPVVGCADLPVAVGLAALGIDSIKSFLEGLIPTFSQSASGLPFTDPVAKFVNTLLDNLRRQFLEVVGEGEKLVDDLWTAGGCSAPQHLSLRAAASIVGFLRQWLGEGFADAMVPLLQQARFLCPGSVPSAEAATAAFLADTIDGDTWKCWVQANNFVGGDFEKVSQAARSKLGISELVQLRARKHISAGEYAKRVRQLGFLNRNEPEEFWTISEQIPGAADLTRFMVRDAADETVVAAFQYDKFFDDKFVGRVKEWADMARIPKDYMKFVWRSHWQIPSPTQLAQMRRRLSGLSPNDPAFVDDDMIRKALEVQDIAPGWIPQFMALMTRPLTRVDARRLLERGIINRAQAVFQWGLLGYNKTDSERLVELAAKIATARAAKHPAVKQFAAGSVTEAELREILEVDGVGEAFANVALRRARLEASIARRKACVAETKRDFLVGGLDASELTQALIGHGLDEPQAVALSEAIQCESKAGGKSVPSSTLCKWFAEGIIDQPQFFSRLTNLGFDSTAATRIIRFCNISIAKKRDADEQRRLKALIAKSAKDQREAKRQEKEMEANRRRGETAARAEARRQKNRRRMLLNIARNMAKRLDISLGASKRNTNTVYNAIVAAQFATPDEALQLMEEASEVAETDSFGALESLTFSLIDSRLFPATV